MKRSNHACGVVIGAVAAALLASQAALGQGNGDYDGDFDVDGVDFFNWAACMTGPAGGPLGPGCDAFDFYTNSAPDGIVDMADFAVFQRRPTGLGGCKKLTKHVRAKLPGMATGCKGKITTRETTLCGEQIPSNKEAASLAWVGVVKRIGTNTNNWKWAQAGYARWRANNSIVVNRNRYIEIKVTPGNSVDVLLRTFSMPAGTHEYQCDLAAGQLFGIWTVEFDGIPMYTSPNFGGWEGVTGTHWEWNAEIHNKEDQMVGTGNTDATKCHFTACEKRESWGGWQSAIFTLGLVKTPDSGEWRRDLGNAAVTDDFRVWDVHP